MTKWLEKLGWYKINWDYVLPAVMIGFAIWGRPCVCRAVRAEFQRPTRSANLTLAVKRLGRFPLA